MEYFDFELRVAPGEGRTYPVSVLRSPAGEAEGTMRFPFDTLALENQLQAVEIAVLRSSGEARRDIARAADPRQPPPVAEFGRQLFEALMSDAVRESFRRSQDRARAAGKGLRVRLRIEDPALAALPWEYLYDPAEGDYVCLSSDTPVVRYLEFDRPPEALTVRPPLSILGVVASPADRPALDVGRERQRVEAATRALREAGLMTIKWLEGSTWRDLQRAMRRGPYHVLHFVGHGGFDAVSGEGVIALTDEEGKSALLSATQLGRLLADHQSLRLAVLNSCLGARGSGADVFSSTASMLVRRGVPAVIAMQYEISDRAAVEFARSLYEALADGMPVDAAVAEARKAVSFAAGGTVEWGTPVLHMRSPDGVLFRIDGPTASLALGKTGERRPAPVARAADAAPAPGAAPNSAAPTGAAPNRTADAPGGPAGARALGGGPAAASGAAPLPPALPAPVKEPPAAPPAPPPASFTPAVAPAVTPASSPATPAAAARPTPAPPRRRGRVALVAAAGVAALAGLYWLGSGPDAPVSPPAPADSAATERVAVDSSAGAADSGSTATPAAPAAVPTATREAARRAPEPAAEADAPTPAPPDRPPAADAAPAEADATPAPDAPAPAGAARRTITAASDGPLPAFTPNAEYPRRKARVAAMTLAGQGNGDWTLGLTLTYFPPPEEYTTTLTCTLRPDEPEQRIVQVPVTLAPDAQRGEFAKGFHVPRPWQPGAYPVWCTSDGGELAYRGRLTVR